MPSAKATLFPSRYDNLLTSDGYFAIKDEEKPIYDNAFIDEFIKSKNITEQEDIDYINEQAKLLKDEFRNLTNTPRFIPSQEQASDLYLPQPQLSGNKENDITAIEEWRDKSLLNASSKLPAQKEDFEYDLEHKANEFIRESVGSETGFVGDKANRIWEGLAKPFFDLADKKSSERYYARNYAENPEHDQDISSAFASGIGQLTGQIAIGAALTYSGQPQLIAPTFGALYGAQYFNEGYTAEMERSGNKSIAIERGISQLPAAALDTFSDAFLLRFLGKSSNFAKSYAKATTEEAKRALIKEAIPSVAKEMGIQFLTEGLIGGAGADIASNLGHYEATGDEKYLKNASDIQALAKSAFVEGTLGALFGGGVTAFNKGKSEQNTAATLSAISEQKAKASEILAALKEKDYNKVITLTGKTVDESNVDQAITEYNKVIEQPAPSVTTPATNGIVVSPERQAEIKARAEQNIINRHIAPIQREVESLLKTEQEKGDAADKTVIDNLITKLTNLKTPIEIGPVIESEGNEIDYNLNVQEKGEQRPNNNIAVIDGKDTKDESIIYVNDNGQLLTQLKVHSTVNGKPTNIAISPNKRVIAIGKGGLHKATGFESSVNPKTGWTAVRITNTNEAGKVKQRVEIIGRVSEVKKTEKPTETKEEAHLNNIAIVVASNMEQMTNDPNVFYDDTKRAEAIANTKELLATIEKSKTALDVTPFQQHLAELESLTKKPTEVEIVQAAAVVESIPPVNNIIEQKTEEPTSDKTIEEFNNPNEFYRVVVGEEAFNDVLNSGLVRTNNQSKVKDGDSLLERIKERPTAFPSFSKGAVSISYAKENPNHYVIVTDDSSMQPSKSGRHSKGKTMFPTDNNGNHLPSLDGTKVKIYKNNDGKYQLVYENGKVLSKQEPKPAKKRVKKPVEEVEITPEIAKQKAIDFQLQKMQDNPPGSPQHENAKSLLAILNDNSKTTESSKPDATKTSPEVSPEPRTEQNRSVESPNKTEQAITLLRQRNEELPQATRDKFWTEDTYSKVSNYIETGDKSDLTPVQIKRIDKAVFDSDAEAVAAQLERDRLEEAKIAEDEKPEPIIDENIEPDILEEINERRATATQERRSRQTSVVDKFITDHGLNPDNVIVVNRVEDLPPIYQNGELYTVPMDTEGFVQGDKIYIILDHILPQNNESEEMAILRVLKHEIVGHVKMDKILEGITPEGYANLVEFLKGLTNDKGVSIFDFKAKQYQTGDEKVIVDEALASIAENYKTWGHTILQKIQDWIRVNFAKLGLRDWSMDDIQAAIRLAVDLKLDVRNNNIRPSKAGTNWNGINVRPDNSFKFRLEDNLRFPGLTVANDGTVPTQNLVAKIEKSSAIQFEKDIISKLAEGLSIGGRVNISDLNNIIQQTPTVDVTELALESENLDEQNKKSSLLAKIQHEADTAGLEMVYDQNTSGFKFLKNGNEIEFQNQPSSVSNAIDNFREYERIGFGNYLSDNQQEKSLAATGKYGVDPYDNNYLKGIDTRQNGLQRAVWAGDLSLNIPFQGQGKLDESFDDDNSIILKEDVHPSKAEERFNELEQQYPEPRYFVTRGSNFNASYNELITTIIVRDTKRQESAKFVSQHYSGDVAENQLAFVRGAIHEYMEGAILPDGKVASGGERIYEIWEVQSDWANHAKKKFQKLVKNGENWEIQREDGSVISTFDDEKTARSILKTSQSQLDPKLEYYETIALKAAVNFAARNNANIVISDAESAMLNEGHDKQARESFKTGEFTKDSAKGWRIIDDKDGINAPIRHTTGKFRVKEKVDSLANQDVVIEIDNGAWKTIRLNKQTTFRKDGMKDTEYHPVDEIFTNGIVKSAIPQEKGMREAYDVRGPNILSKLTGSKPVKADMGVHNKLTLGEYYEYEPKLYTEGPGQGAKEARDRALELQEKDNSNIRHFIAKEVDGGAKVFAADKGSIFNRTQNTGRLFKVSGQPLRFSKAQRPTATEKNPFTYRIHDLINDDGTFAGGGSTIASDGTIKEIALKKNLPEREFELYKLLVPSAFENGHVDVRKLDNDLRDLPAIEVHSYGQSAKESEAKKELDKMTHDWYDLLEFEAQKVVDSKIDPSRGRLAYEDAYLKNMDQEKLNKYIELAKAVAKEKPTNNLRATSYYNSISPLDTKKHPVKRIDIVLPQTKSNRITKDAAYKRIQEREGFTDEEMEDYIENGNAGAGISRPNRSIWPQDNLHENLPNTLGWAMVQETTHNGEPVWFIGEMQSRWGQERSKDEAQKKGYTITEEKDGWKLTSDRTGRSVLYDTREELDNFLESKGNRTPSHPLLSKWETLTLNAVIDQAKRAGINKIILSDGETAMMTEQQDKHPILKEGEYNTSEELRDLNHRPWTKVRILEGGNKAELLTSDGYVDKSISTYSNSREFDLIEKFVPKAIKQESGMRAQYDERSPNILRKLTGDKGTPVDLGIHKNGETDISYVPIEQHGYEKFATEDEANDYAKSQRERYNNHADVDVRERDDYFVVITQPHKNYGSPTLKNPDGTPKTNITGREFDITNVSNDIKYSKAQRESSLRGSYGAWIDKNGTIIPVPHEGHLEKAIELLSDRKDLLGIRDLYQEMFNQGYARVVNGNPIMMEGKMSPAQRATAEFIGINDEKEISYNNKIIYSPPIRASKAKSESDLHWEANQQRFSKAQTYGEDFKSWFGDWENNPEQSSKVVDEKGEPLVVYHGTQNNTVWAETDFDIFFPLSHFGTAKAASERVFGIDYASGQKIYPVYLNIRNPLEMSDNKKGHKYTDFVTEVVNQGLITREEANKFTRDLVQDWQKKGIAKDEPSENSFRAALSLIRHLGYDGFKYTNNVEDAGSTSWVALYPNQIKSSTANNGSFNPNNPDIRFSKAQNLSDSESLFELSEEVKKDNPYGKFRASKKILDRLPTALRDKLEGWIDNWKGSGTTKLNTYIRDSETVFIKSDSNYTAYNPETKQESTLESMGDMRGEFADIMPGRSIPLPTGMVIIEESYRSDGQPTFTIYNNSKISEDNRIKRSIATQDDFEMANDARGDKVLNDNIKETLKKKIEAPLIIEERGILDSLKAIHYTYLEKPDKIAFNNIIENFVNTRSKVKNPATIRETVNELKVLAAEYSKLADIGEFTYLQDLVPNNPLGQLDQYEDIGQVRNLVEELISRNPVDEFAKLDPTSEQDAQYKQAINELQSDALDLINDPNSSVYNIINQVRAMIQTSSNPLLRKGLEYVERQVARTEKVLHQYLLNLIAQDSDSLSKVDARKVYYDLMSIVHDGYPSRINHFISDSIRVILNESETSFRTPYKNRLDKGLVKVESFATKLRRLATDNTSVDALNKILTPIREGILEAERFHDEVHTPYLVQATKNRNGTAWTEQHRRAIGIYAKLRQTNVNEKPSDGLLANIRQIQQSNKEQAKNFDPKTKEAGAQNTNALNQLIAGIDLENVQDSDMLKVEENALALLGQDSIDYVGDVVALFETLKPLSKLTTEFVYGRPFMEVNNYIPSMSIAVNGAELDVDAIQLMADAESVRKYGADKTINQKGMASTFERNNKLKSGHVLVLDINHLSDSVGRLNTLDYFTALPRREIATVLDPKSVWGKQFNKFMNDDGGQFKTELVREAVTTMWQNQLIRASYLHEYHAVANWFTRKWMGSVLSGIHQFANQTITNTIPFFVKNITNPQAWSDYGKAVDMLLRYNSGNLPQHSMKLFETLLAEIRNRHQDAFLDKGVALHSGGIVEAMKKNMPSVYKALKGSDKVIEKGLMFQFKLSDMVSGAPIMIAEYYANEKARLGNSLRMEDMVYNPESLFRAVDETDRFIGVGAISRRGEYLTNRNPGISLARNLLVAFRSFTINNATNFNVERKRFFDSDLSQEERLKSAKYMMGIAMQSAAFQGIKVYINMMLASGIISLLRNPDDDDELKALYRKSAGQLDEKQRRIIDAEIAARQQIRNAFTKLTERNDSSRILAISMAKDTLSNMFVTWSLVPFGPDLIIHNTLDADGEEQFKQLKAGEIAQIERLIKRHKALGNNNIVAILNDKLDTINKQEFLPSSFEDKSISGLGGSFGGAAKAIEGAMQVASDTIIKTKDLSAKDVLALTSVIGLGQPDIKKFAITLERIQEAEKEKQEKIKKSYEKARP